MKRTSKSYNNVKVGHLKKVLTFVGIVTLILNPNLEDPFNSPKFWVLLVFGSWLAGYFLIDLIQYKHLEVEVRLFLNLILIFICLLFVSALISDNKYNAFLGENFRKLGFLTYTILGITSYLTAKWANYTVINVFYLFNGMLGFIVAGYGLLQYLDKDFFSWNNPYNSIISTLGNPNFAAASIAISFTISFGAMLNQFLANQVRFLSGILCLFQLSVIFLSNARQGLMTAGIASFVIVIHKFYSIKKYFGLMSVLTLSVFSIFVVFALFQKGPLSALIYKDSISIRGYYWRAGLEMLKNNLFFGVGLDSYGDNFKFYREPKYSLIYGVDITSSNAHNVPLQLAATGGIFLGISYFLLILYTLKKFINGYKASNSLQRNFITTVFSAWIAYQAQSIISIDNLGLAIWGWMLTGLIIGLSNRSKKNIKLNNSDNQDKFNKQDGKDIIVKWESLRIILSSILCLVSIVFVSFLYQGEKGTIKMRVYADSLNTSQVNLFLDEISKTSKIPLIDPYYKLQMALLLSNRNLHTNSIDIIEDVLSSEPKNLDALILQAYNREVTGEIEKAVNLRKRIAKIDPYNSRNYLELGKLYKAQGNYNGMQKMLEKIGSLSKSTPEYKLAEIELKIG